MTAPPAVDDDLCARVRAGDRSATADLLARHHPISSFVLAALVGASAPDSGDPVLNAVWREVLGDIAAGSLSTGLRAAVLGRLITALADRGLLDAAPPPPARARFLPPADRWAGWWADDPVELAPGALTRSSALTALRALPVEARAVLLLRDAAGLTPCAVEDIVRAPEAQQNAILDDARRCWVDIVMETA